MAMAMALEGLAHSPVHMAVARGDHGTLRALCTALPPLADPVNVTTEEESLSEEAVADSIAAVIDRRDVPGRETPLHLAVRLGDVEAAEVLMSAGANWSLQNEAGWSALQEAICQRQDRIAVVIMRHYQPMAWAKWCRRLPRLVACLRRMRDFYMEIHFEFQSSVIPFVARIAPSDTYRIWKHRSNLRADTTLAGFDGFRIHRAQQSFLFLGDGLPDGRAPPGSLLVLSHRDKEVMNAFEDAGEKPSKEDVEKEVLAMVHTNVYRPGIDVTQAQLVPQLTWRRNERSESVGRWRAKVYDMHNVMISFKSRKVCGERFTEVADDAAPALDLDLDLDLELDDYGNMLTDDDEKHSMSISDVLARPETATATDIDSNDHDEDTSEGCRRRRHSVGSDDGRDSHLPRHHSRRTSVDGRKWISSTNVNGDGRRSSGKDASADGSASGSRSSSISARGGSVSAGGSGSGSDESVYKKGLRPVLWLSKEFPLQTDELLPLLDILANKVKAVRRLRELLTTKLPPGTFPVKMAIPVIPTIRVVVTFTKFEDLTAPASSRSPGDDNEEFQTPPTSPDNSTSTSGKSWIPWIRGQSTGNADKNAKAMSEDPFAVPMDYRWTTVDAKKKQMRNKKSSSSKPRRSRRSGSNGSSVDSSELPSESLSFSHS